MILAFLIVAQSQPADVAQDREAFEPYRRCVLIEARSQYNTRSNLREIFATAKHRCVKASLDATADLALNAARRTIEVAAEGALNPEPVEMRFAQFETELLFELASDFVPKAK